MWANGNGRTSAQHCNEVFTPHSGRKDTEIRNFLEVVLQLSLLINNFKYSKVNYKIDNVNKRKPHVMN